jgi:lipopolysaccharide/colanic/teichoic acid biosynthesis glycosyltransferase
MASTRRLTREKTPSARERPPALDRSATAAPGEVSHGVGRKQVHRTSVRDAIGGTTSVRPTPHQALAMTAATALATSSTATVAKTVHLPVPDVVRIPLAKRLLDVLLSGFGLIASAPLWLLIAVALKLEDGGPVFYAQERVGEGGRLFDALKFRSMIPDAEAGVGAVQATEDDPRVTRVGRLMRATAMDELPQLWNIFRGDMSFVGPRALRPGEIEVNGAGQLLLLHEIPGYVARSRVRPGLTGIAQIFAPRDVSRRNKFRFDRLYVERQSLGLDLKLIVLSFWITFRGRWEHRGDKV